MYTGTGNDIILEHFLKLSGESLRIQARMPVVPGINDDIINIQRTAELLAAANQKTIHLLPYHPLGESKIKRIIVI